MKKIALVLGGGRWQIDLAKSASELNLRTIVTDISKDAPARLIADEFIQIDTNDRQGLLEIARAKSVSIVLADQSDRLVPVAAFLNEQLGLNGIRPNTAHVFTDKYAMRNALAQSEVPMPRYAEISTVEEAVSKAHRWGYPLILKPKKSQSSVGVFKITDERELHQRFAQSMKLSGDVRILLEEFIKGAEITVEALSISGRFYVLATSEKTHYDFNPCVARRLAYPPSLDEQTIARVAEVAENVVTSLGLQDGISHAEYRLRDGFPYLVEVAARGGGNHIASVIVKHVSGIDVYSLMIRRLLGETVTIPARLRRAANLEFLHFKSGRVKAIKGVDEVLAANLVSHIELDFCPRDTIESPKDDKSRHGYFITLGDTRDEIDAKAARVKRMVRVEYDEFDCVSPGRTAKGNRSLQVVKPEERDREAVKCSRPKFSGVVADSHQAMSIKYNNLVYELRRNGVDVTVLSLGEAFFDIPLFPMDDLPFPQIYHYTHSRGIPDLREKLCRYYERAHGVAVDMEKEIIVTAGSKAAIHFSMMSVLNPGDEVILHEPTWVSYPEQVKLCYAKPILMPYTCAVHDYEKYLTHRSKMIVINNPNNPRGNVLNEQELRYLVDLAKANGLYILADEAYGDFLIDAQFHSLGLFDRDKQNVIICNSISKNFGISGWRLGYCITNEALTNQILKVNQHLITCPAAILQYYIAKHFEDIIEITRPQIAEVIRTRNEVADFMDDLGLRYLSGTSTFYFFVSIAPSTLSSEEFCMRLLMDDHISVVPGKGYGDSCDGFVRLSVGTEPIAAIKNGLKKLKESIDRTS